LQIRSATFPSTRQPLVCSGTVRPLGTAAREGPTGPFCLSRIKNDLILNIIFWPLFSFRADHDPGETNTAQHSFVPERETGVTRSMPLDRISNILPQGRDQRHPVE
jgi:hypothetical protein